MAQHNVFGKISLKSGADLRDKMYHLVKLDNDGDLILCGNNEISIGVLDGKPNVGENVSVIILGTSKIVSGGEINVGSLVISNEQGKVIKLPPQNGVYNVIGVALQQSNGDGEIIEVLLRPMVVKIE